MEVGKDGYVIWVCEVRLEVGNRTRVSHTFLYQATKCCNHGQAAVGYFLRTELLHISACSFVEGVKPPTTRIANVSASTFVGFEEGIG